MLGASPAVAQIDLGDQLDAIRLAGSYRMMAHTLSTAGLPVQAREARDKLLGNMGYLGEFGDVSKPKFNFSPILAHDGNINGGFASDSFTISGIPFTVGEEYKAVSGVVFGMSASTGVKVSLGENSMLDLNAGASIAYSPEYEMSKLAAGASACLNHMFSYSTYGYACLNATYKSYELGETKAVSGRTGLSHVFNSGFGVHEVSGGIQLNRMLSGAEYDQAIANLSLSSAVPGPYAVTFGVQLGENVDDVLVMRERLYASVGFHVLERPTSVMLSVQNNRGGSWLGEARSDVVTTIGLSHQVSDKLTVSGTVSVTESSAEFFEDTQYGMNFAWRF
jgi:hypothetical protein